MCGPGPGLSSLPLVSVYPIVYNPVVFDILGCACLLSVFFSEIGLASLGLFSF